MASKSDRKLLRALRAALHAAAEPARAPQQQAYMKSAMPYLGITAPVLHRIHREVLRAHPLTDAQTWLATVMVLWRRASHREERYAALALLGYPAYRNWLTPAILDELQEIIVTGAWWDYVDQLAANQFGWLLTTYPKQLKPLLKRWSTSDDIWLRRTAILSQLKFKDRTDQALLFRLIEPSLGRREFFLRKAIGWALRAYSKSNPAAVINYIEDNRDRLAPLSKKEGLKVLLKQGVVSEVP